MKARSTSNPDNRFAKQTVAYDEGEGPPPATVSLIEDHSKTILSSNDSPDLGFRWSANPYRGCLHACAYCLAGDTRIRLVDGRTKALADLRIGDAIIGTRLAHGFRFLVPTVVQNHWTTQKPAYRVTLADGSSLVASGDHRFLTERGWKFVMPARPPFQRPALTPADSLVAAGSPRLRRIGMVHAESSRAELFVGGGGTAPVPSILPIDIGRTARPRDTRVVTIEPVGTMELFDITTGTGDFIANGVVSHNCYARPTHEYLDLGAGTDFDTKIVVKREAPALVRAAFDKPSWRGETIMFSGVTDCYQAIERDLELTRRCLEVCLEYRNPVSVISKSALVERDIDLFQELAKQARFHIAVSLAWTDADMARAMEPWAPSPERRLKTIETLARAGVPVGIVAAPIIPGLNDSQLVGLLERAASAGATQAGWVLLRLPGAVAQVFPERLQAAMPLSADKVLHRIRSTRGGEKLYQSEFGTRGRGEGPYAETIATIFEATCDRLKLNRRAMAKPDVEEPTTFRRPQPRTAQLSLF